MNAYSKTKKLPGSFYWENSSGNFRSPHEKCMKHTDIDLLGNCTSTKPVDNRDLWIVRRGRLRVLSCAHDAWSCVIWAGIPFSSPEPVVSWSCGRETRGSPLVGYKLSQVALGTRMREYLIIVVILQRVLARMSYIVAETSFRMLEVLSFSSIGRGLDLLQ